MKILLLADCNSVHTIKWATSLAKRNIEIIVFSISNLEVDDYKSTSVEVIDYGNSISRESYIQKAKYLKALPYLKNIIKSSKPDIIHAHYATSYGLLGALSNFHPFILSVWGSDVFDFPHKSFLHRQLLKFNLKKADKILSTSKVMALETEKYISKPIEVTPFGIDLEVFKPFTAKSLFNKNDIVIGTIKTLEKKYGIIYLIQAFKILILKFPNKPLKLLLVGGGSLLEEMQKLVKDLDIEDKVIFTGNISFREIPNYHNIIDIFVALSLKESFGVAIIEASACCKPVVVSNVGGLPEVVKDHVTGFIVPPKDEVSASKVIEKLIIDEGLRRKMGENGRKRVQKLYNWNNNVEQMVEIYKELVQ